MRRDAAGSVRRGSQGALDYGFGEGLLGALDYGFWGVMADVGVMRRDPFGAQARTARGAQNGF